MVDYYQMPMLRGRPVSSIEEVRAAIVNFDGIPTYFPDLANGRIYTKQINLDGTASLTVYEKKELQAPAQYITREEFENALTELYSKLNPPAPAPEVAKMF